MVLAHDRFDFRRQLTGFAEHLQYSPFRILMNISPRGHFYNYFIAFFRFAEMFLSDQNFTRQSPIIRYNKELFAYTFEGPDKRMNTALNDPYYFAFTPCTAFFLFCALR